MLAVAVLAILGAQMCHRCMTGTGTAAVCGEREGHWLGRSVTQYGGVDLSSPNLS